MALTPGQIERIRTRAPGWKEVDLQQLMSDLLDAMETTSRCPLFQWPCDDDRQEFVSEMLADALQKASDGTLLANYDPSMGDVPEFLTGQGFRKRAIGYLIKLSKRLQSLSLSESGDILPTPSKTAGRSPEDRSYEPSFELNNLRLKIAGDGKVTKILEQAGLQLFPRLDWAQDRIDKLLSHLISLRNGRKDGSELKWLEEIHHYAAIEYQKTTDLLGEKKYNKGKGLGARQTARLDARLERVFFESVFLPLTACIIMEILSIKRNTADQLRRRYRHSLPELLPELKMTFASHMDMTDDESPQLRNSDEDIRPTH